MKFAKLKSAGVVAAMMMASNALAASITYTGMQSVDGGTVDYSFTTDGTIGAINNNNILGFNFDVAKSGVTFSISSSSAIASFYQDGFFTATATTLNLVSGNSVASFAAISTSGVVGFNGDDNGTFFVNSSFLNGQIPGIGSTPIATSGVVTAVPEPTTWALMIGGFGLVGGTMRRRNSIAVTVRFA